MIRSVLLPLLLLQATVPLFSPARQHYSVETAPYHHWRRIWPHDPPKQENPSANPPPVPPKWIIYRVPAVTRPTRIRTTTIPPLTTPSPTTTTHLEPVTSTDFVTELPVTTKSPGIQFKVQNKKKQKKTRKFTVEQLDMLNGQKVTEVYKSAEMTTSTVPPPVTTSVDTTVNFIRRYKSPRSYFYYF